MRSSLLILAIASLLLGCGWQLRGSQTADTPLPNIRVVSDDNYSPMVRTLLDVRQQQSDSDSGALPVYVIQIIEETVDKRPVTYTASGAPAQYEMTLELTYAVQRSDMSEPSLPQTISTHRLFDFDPRNVVAKTEEERVLLQEMRRQLAQRLLSDIRRRHGMGGSAPQDASVNRGETTR